MSLEQAEREYRERGNNAAADEVKFIRERFGPPVPEIIKGGDSSPSPQETEQVEIKRFSDEAREALEKKGFVIHELTAQSIKSLREKGGKFWLTWHRNNPDFETLTSMQSEIAINPNRLFLPDSNNKTLKEQEEMISKFSQELGESIPEVKAMMGEAPDYVDLAFTHLDKTGHRLFGKEDNFSYTITKTTTVGTDVARVGYFNQINGLGVNSWNGGSGDRDIFAAPLIVPV